MLPQGVTDGNRPLGIVPAKSERFGGPIKRVPVVLVPVSKAVKSS